METSYADEKKFKIYAFADEASPLIDKQIEAMKNNNLNGLEIRNVDDVNVSEITIAKAKEVRQKLDNAGLVTWSIGSPIGKIDIEKDDFDAHLEKLKHTLEIANILGAENLRLFSFYIPKEKSAEEYTDEVINRLGIMADTAIMAGIIPCHENEKGIYGDVAERCLKIHTALPVLQGVFDPANFVQCGQDTALAWKQLNPYIKYLHIKDSLSDGSVVPAGKGIGYVPEILKDFIGLGGKDITIEPHLAVFKGLGELEQEEKKSEIGKFQFPDNITAFNAACDALKSLL